MNNVSPASAHDLASPASGVDPVCGMTVQADKSAGRVGLLLVSPATILWGAIQVLLDERRQRAARKKNSNG